MKKKIFVALFAGLNPCCNGRGSRTANAFTVSTSVSLVLILVVVDDGLVHNYGFKESYCRVALILVVVDVGHVRNMTKERI